MSPVDQSIQLFYQYESYISPHYDKQTNKHTKSQFNISDNDGNYNEDYNNNSNNDNDNDNNKTSGYHSQYFYNILMQMVLHC